jgi:AcrR family transcriptional regulator
MPTTDTPRNRTTDAPRNRTTDAPRNRTTDAPRTRTTDTPRSRTTGAGTSPRRTQAERRAATRSALLDAALELLVEDGYANLTTRRIAARAGVSQGAQQHYFRSKSELVLESVRHAIAQIAADGLHRTELLAAGGTPRQEAMLDEMWAVHQSPAFKATLELWAAARSDAELRRSLRGLERSIAEMIRQSTRVTLAEDADNPEMRELVNVLLATIRGIAMLAPVVPRTELERRWAAAKPSLLELWGKRLAAARAPS